MKSLTIFKNIIWAIGIVACLLALVVGFGISAFTRYSLPEAGEALGEEENIQEPTGTLNRLGETADGGQGYLDSLTFLVDSTLIGLRDYGMLSDGVTTNKVWGSSAGNISVENMADPTIRLGDGTEKTVSQAAAEAKPGVLIVSLGMDSLQKVDRATFEANYTALINNIRAASPNTKIVLCSLSSVTSAYNSPDGITIEMANTAEGWVQNVCRNTGVYYADVTKAVKDTSGTLLSDYAGVNNKALNTTGLNKVLEYLRSHTVA